jgi:hypothetical protein
VSVKRRLPHVYQNQKEQKVNFSYIKGSRRNKRISLVDIKENKTKAKAKVSGEVPHV